LEVSLEYWYQAIPHIGIKIVGERRTSSRFFEHNWKLGRIEAHSMDERDFQRRSGIVD
jgi:hypothetical protein